MRYTTCGRSPRTFRRRSAGVCASPVTLGTRTLAAVARAMGYPAGATQDLLEDYRRATRRARAVYEDVFFA